MIPGYADFNFSLLFASDEAPSNVKGTSPNPTSSFLYNYGG